MYEEDLHGMYVSHYISIWEMQSLCGSFEFWRLSPDRTAEYTGDAIAVFRVIGPAIQGFGNSLNRSFELRAR